LNEFFLLLIESKQQDVTLPPFILPRRAFLFRSKYCEYERFSICDVQLSGNRDYRINNARIDNERGPSA